VALNLTLINYKDQTELFISVVYNSLLPDINRGLAKLTIFLITILQ